MTVYDTPVLFEEIRAVIDRPTAKFQKTLWHYLIRGARRSRIEDQACRAVRSTPG
jgi:hypothetical protein